MSKKARWLSQYRRADEIPRLRQPVVGDVVEDVVPRDSAGLSDEGALDELVALARRGRSSRRPDRPANPRWRRASAAEGPSPAHRRCRSRRSGPGRRRPSFSSADRPAGAAAPELTPCEISGDSVAGMLVWIPSNPAGLQQRQLLGDGVPPVPALGHVALVPEALHQHDPGARDADRVPAGLGRLAGEAVARQRRDHEVEGVGGVGAVGGRDRSAAR